MAEPATKLPVKTEQERPLALREWRPFERLRREIRSVARYSTSSRCGGVS
jgi:hypothetical protein